MRITGDFLFFVVQRKRNNRFHSTSRAGRPIRSRFLAAMRGRVGNNEPRVLRAAAGRFGNMFFLIPYFACRSYRGSFRVRVGKIEADITLWPHHECDLYVFQGMITFKLETRCFSRFRRTISEFDGRGNPYTSFQVEGAPCAHLREASCSKPKNKPAARSPSNNDK